MTDELDLLRGADPVPADAERWRDRPLDFDGERRLRQLVSGPGAAVRSDGSSWAWPRRRRGRWSPSP
ncbi:hypothetical protein SAZ11_05745 [Streptomyces sp. FXJ1.4098]|nr:hypothetical protein [Streptomyces sp. FXJ1.4098]